MKIAIIVMQYKLNPLLMCYVYKLDDNDEKISFQNINESMYWKTTTTKHTKQSANFMLNVTDQSSLS